MRRFCRRPGPFLTVCHLTFKIQENYRILASTAVLAAVILSAADIYVITEADARTSAP